MRLEKYSIESLEEVFFVERVLSLESIGRFLGTPSKRTIARKLDALGCRASYSHAGRYYTLEECADYNQYGLWSFRNIHFSKYGTLINTILHLVNDSQEGYFASELRDLLDVRVHNALAKLYASRRLFREQIQSQYLYLSYTFHVQQLERRRESIQRRLRVSDIANEDEEFTEAIKESICFLVSHLNEKQRRLYLGLESMKLGHGGDVRISKITGVNVKTIARGRHELEQKNISFDRIRRAGAGRPALKKL
ncbi:MAG: hypothetical protein JRH18_22350 [Deltaproteobacteria bacterium]|nr:hypothetical protein [Deltaproteobacteria bacterium]MBW2154394.1 hypothetical protein [Deltaproteobacteria bacterium]